MAIDNQISVAFTQAELDEIDGHLTGLENIFKGKTVQLTPKESQRYGKLGNETENWVDMVYADTKANNSLAPDFVDLKEWDIDDAARSVLSERATRLANIATQVTDTNRLIGFDLYQTSLTVYNSTKFKATQNAPGAKAFYDKWSVQFPGRKGKK